MLPDDDAAADGDLRVIDESGEDYLYSVDRFVLIDLPQELIKRMQSHVPEHETDYRSARNMKKWKTYEEVATYLLNRFASEFGLSHLEGKQKIQGQRSGTEWEIDAKGVREGNEGFVIVECRRYTTSNQSQEKLGGLAYRIIDTGAEGRILVSPMGMQEGAKKIADAENIINVQLASDSTPFEYFLRFLNKVMVGLQETIMFTENIVVVKKSGSDN